MPLYYEDCDSVYHFLKEVRKSLPFHSFEPIQRAFNEKDKMFKCVALSHLNKHFKKGKLSKEDFTALLELLDTFSDPYQEFVERTANRGWEDIKSNILGEIL